MKMNSMCAYLKFDPELSICAGKNKHSFHIKEVNFIIYFGFKNNPVLGDIFVCVAYIYYSTLLIKFYVANNTK
jgi:hypothetical protein